MVKESTLESVLQNEMSDLWAVLSNEEKRIILSNFQIQNFRKNEVIYSEGEKPTHLMFLLKGKVKVYKKGNGDRNQIIRSLANYLGQSDTRTVNLTQKHIRGRLAEALIVLLENYVMKPIAQLSTYTCREKIWSICQT